MLTAEMPDQQHDDFRRIRSPFQGALVRLRAFEEDDIPAVNEMVWDPEVSQHLAIAWPQPLAGTRQFWEGARKAEDGLVLAVETLRGELVGLCGLESISTRNHSAALGIWIGKPFWDRGFGTDAVRTLCRFGFGEMHLNRIALTVYATNPRGRRAYEKVGFKEEGRWRSAQFVGGQLVDVIEMGLLADDLLEA
jgi:RimJ/RimL family protein N-acetyltransferase